MRRWASASKVSCHPWDHILPKPGKGRLKRNEMTTFLCVASRSNRPLADPKEKGWGGGRGGWRRKLSELKYSGIQLPWDSYQANDINFFHYYRHKLIKKSKCISSSQSLILLTSPMVRACTLFLESTCWPTQTKISDWQSRMNISSVIKSSWVKLYISVTWKNDIKINSWCKNKIELIWYDFHIKTL